MTWHRTVIVTTASVAVAASLSVAIVRADAPALRLAPGQSTSPRPAESAPGSPVAAENRLAGDPGWRIAPDAPRGVEGFASPGVDAGVVTLYVRTQAASVRATVYRIGWYGGVGARRMTSLGPSRGDPQSPCPTLGARLTIACSWRPTFRVKTRSDWTSGLYLTKLVDSAGAQAYVPFVVRERTPRARVLFTFAVTTWQAYNRWGGRSLYRGPPSACARCVTRSRAVSFDRPYEWPGAGNLFGGEFQAIQWIESRGLDVGYATSVDLHERAVALERRRVFLSVGHDEYYSGAMRSEVTHALARGTSLVFLGANDIYRRIRFERSPVGADRVMVGYKNLSREDRVARADPASSTGNWRSPPLNEPEQAILGAQYDECSSGSRRSTRAPGDWIPTGEPAWLLRGTGLEAGVPVRRLVQGEYDRVFTDVPRPRGLIIVARSAVPCGTTTSEQNSVFYIAPSGAAVFDAGIQYFACALGPVSAPFDLCRDSTVDPRIQRLVSNLLEAMLDRRWGTRERSLAAGHGAVPP